MARRRGRPSKDTKQTSIYLSTEVLGKVEMYLMDPAKGKIKYGTLSTLLNELLRRFLLQVAQSDRDPVEIFQSYGIDLRMSADPPKSQEDYWDGLT